MRDLSLQEWNFYKLLQDHLHTLLERQRLYWKQRGSIKWAQLGDAGTHFFHANATIRHRNNLISHLTNRQGFSVCQHKDKEEIIF